MFRLILLLAFLFLPASMGHAEEDFATLEVRVEGIKDHPGELGVALYENKKGFPTHLEHAYEPAWTALKKGMTTVEQTFEGLAAGDYAVSVVHDENGNRKVDRSALGFPKEGVGFSNDQKVRLSAPKFDKCAFNLSEGEHKKIVITLDYRNGN